jgi:hypothetical protein
MSADGPAHRRRRSTGIFRLFVPMPAPPADALPDLSEAKPAEITAAPRRAREPASADSSDRPFRPPDASAAIVESLSRLWAFAIPTRLVFWQASGDWWPGPIISGTLPLILNAILLLAYGNIALRTAEAWEWLVIFAITQAGALLLGRLLWARLVRDMPLIATMLPDKSANDKLSDWIRSWCSVPKQAVAGGGLALLGAFVLKLASPVVGRYLELGPVSYITVVWTSFMMGLLLYTFSMAVLITWKVSKCGPLRLEMWDPAGTPGLRSLSHGYVYCVCMIIVFAAGLELAATRVPGYRTSNVLGAFIVGFPIFAVLCGLLVSILPHAIIAHLTYVSKRQSMVMIDESMGDIGRSIGSDHGRLVTLVWLRSQVGSAPSLPIRAPWLVPVMAALLGPLVAFLLTLNL